MPKKMNINANPIHAAGVFRKFGSGGANAAAETKDVTNDEQIHANRIRRSRCITRGYLSSTIIATYVAMNRLEHPGYDKFPQ